MPKSCLANVTVGAVVVTYRRPAVLKATLQAILAQSLGPAWIIVVDNANDDRLFRGLAAEFPQVHYLPMKENLGYGAGLARGMVFLQEHYDPDWYWLLDDDTPPADDDLVNALSWAIREPKPSVVANRGGRLSCGRVRHNLYGVTAPQEADFTLIDGAIIAKSAVETAGFPRDDLFMMCEDLDYTTRIASGGGILLVRPSQVRAMHLGSSSVWRGYYQARNHLRLAIDRRSMSWIWGWLYRMLALTFTDVARRRWRLLFLRWKGALDGVRGSMGRTLEIHDIDSGGVDVPYR